MWPHFKVRAFHGSSKPSVDFAMRLEVTEGRTEEAIRNALRDSARPFRSSEAVGAAMRRLLANNLADLPLPAGGQTLERWRTLAAVAAVDLSLAKVYEGHTDALAILAELHGPKATGLWAVWAAEPPQARVTIHLDENGGTLSGRKAWCSGATAVDSAVLSVWTPDEQSILVAVSLRQPGIRVETDGWKAVGMAASESATVLFDGARAEIIGGPGDYVARPGFWQGGAGIAAVWYGATVAVARTLADSTKVASDPHAAAHLGAVDTALRAARALLIETATWIDTHPTADAAAAALRVRACVEAAAHEVLLRTGRALGPALLCGDAIHAQRCADLPVFLRQSHAEHDLAALGRAIATHSPTWNL